LNQKLTWPLLFTANAVSGFAQGISMIAIPWHFARHQQGPQFNFLYGCATFLILFWSLYAGTLVDRFPRKRVFLLTNLIQGAIVLGVAAYGWHFGLTTPLIAAVFLITFLGYQIHYPNLYAFAQEVTEPTEYRRITSHIEIVGQATSLVAGGAAAILLEGFEWQAEFTWLGLHIPFHLRVSPWAMHHVFALDGLTYLLSFALIACIRYVPYRTLHVESGSLLKRLQSGFAYLRAHPVILLFGLLSFNVFVAAVVQLQALLPMYITNHLGEGGQSFGIAELTGSIGAMSAGILVRRLFTRTSLPQAVITLMLLASVNFFVASFTQHAWIFYTFSMLNGFFNSSTRILRVSYLFDHVPNEIIGRVNSILGMLNVIIRMVFVFLFSQAYFGQGSNITYAYLIMGAFVLLSAGALSLIHQRLTATAS
jgi:MFS transporter, DHA3 family, macrolide efflux protein